MVQCHHLYLKPECNDGPERADEEAYLPELLFVLLLAYERRVRRRLVGTER